MLSGARRARGSETGRAQRVLDLNIGADAEIRQGSFSDYLVVGRPKSRESGLVVLGCVDVTD
jgi:hypothetical protein